MQILNTILTNRYFRANFYFCVYFLESFTFNSMSICNNAYKNFYQSILVAYFIWSFPGKSEVYKSEIIDNRYGFYVLDLTVIMWTVMVWIPWYPAFLEVCYRNFLGSFISFYTHLVWIWCKNQILRHNHVTRKLISPQLLLSCIYISVHC